VVFELVTVGEFFDHIIELQRYSEKDAVHDSLSGLKHMHNLRIVTVILRFVETLFLAKL